MKRIFCRMCLMLLLSLALTGCGKTEQGGSATEQETKRNDNTVSVTASEVVKAVFERTSHQELHGKIVKLFCLGPPDGFFGFLPVVSGIIPDQGTQCLIAFDWIRVLKIMAKLAGDPFLVAFYESIF